LGRAVTGSLELVEVLLTEAVFDVIVGASGVILLSDPHSDRDREYRSFREPQRRAVKLRA
jgi:hypothetical protein